MGQGILLLIWDKNSIDGIFRFPVVVQPLGLKFFCLYIELGVWHHVKLSMMFLQLKLHEWEGQDKKHKSEDWRVSLFTRGLYHEAELGLSEITSGITTKMDFFSSGYVAPATYAERQTWGCNDEPFISSFTRLAHWRSLRCWAAAAVLLRAMMSFLYSWQRSRTPLCCGDWSGDANPAPLTCARSDPDWQQLDSLSELVAGFVVQLILVDGDPAKSKRVVAGLSWIS